MSQNKILSNHTSIIEALSKKGIDFNIIRSNPYKVLISNGKSCVEIDQEVCTYIHELQEILKLIFKIELPYEHTNNKF